MNTTNTRSRLLALATLLALVLPGMAQAKPHECAKKCKQEDNCEVCTIVLCEKRRQQDGSLKDAIVGRKTETTCEVPATAATPTAIRYHLGGAGASEGDARSTPWNRAAVVMQNSTASPAARVSRPTVDGKAATTIAGRYEVAAAPTGRWNVRPGAISVPRRFESWEAFGTFAENNLDATVYRDAAGNITGVGGQYEWSAGDVPARNEDADDLPDVVASILGGAEKQLVIGREQISFAPGGNDTTSFSPFSSTRENCVDRHCVEGKSWVTHLIFYHSVGTRTRQTSGGTDIVPRPCCSSGGELVREDGEYRCRGRRPGAWEYDREAGRLLPTGTDPYVFTDAKSCNRESLRNQLRVSGAFFKRGGQRPVNQVTTVKANTREVEIGEWLLSLGLETSNYAITDIHGVCGTHASNRGESVRTAEGSTGDNDSRCL